MAPAISPILELELRLAFEKNAAEVACCPPREWSQISHEYTKIGDFWFPANHGSVTHVLLGGQATLTINYDDYKVVSPRKVIMSTRHSH